MGKFSNIRKIRKTPEHILTIPEPTREQLAVALKANPSLLTYLIDTHEIDYDLIVMAVVNDKYGNLIFELEGKGYIIEEDLKILTLKNRGEKIKKMSNLSFDMIFASLENYLGAYNFLPEITREILIKACSVNGNVLKYIDDYDQIMELEAVCSLNLHQRNFDIRKFKLAKNFTKVGKKKFLESIIKIQRWWNKLFWDPKFSIRKKILTRDYDNFCLVKLV